MCKSLAAGNYPVDGKAFYIGTRLFLFRVRKEKGNRKPEMFLVALRPFEYVSSLYPSMTKDVYAMEVGGAHWAVRFDDYSVQLSKAAPVAG